MSRLIITILFITLIIALYKFTIKKVPQNKRKLINLYLLILLVLLITILIILYPQNALNAAAKGLFTWSNIIIPSLLPFFIFSEILIGLGFVNFIGALLQPIIKPLFNVPGLGGFTMSMSFISGYPVGAKIVSQLRQKKYISKNEGQRLLSFCSTSGPLFMIGAVSIGMFNNPSIGSLIAISHYLGAITVGIIFRFYPFNKKMYLSSKTAKINNPFKELIIARKKDGRSIGLLIANSVKEAINTILLIGGFVIFYSVIIEMINVTNIFKYLSIIISKLYYVNINEKMIKGILGGLIEITNGCSIISSLHEIPLNINISICSFLIGWSGLSIHSQAISFISKTDIKINIYILSKLLHGITSSIYSYILYELLFKKVIPIFSNSFTYLQNENSKWLNIFSFSLKIQITLLVLTVMISVISLLINKYLKR